MGAARQNALMAAHGDYIMFVDSDDFLPENAVEKLIENTKGQTGLTEATANGTAERPQNLKDPLLKMERCSSKCSSARTSSQTGYGEDSTDDR